MVVSNTFTTRSQLTEINRDNRKRVLNNNYLRNSSDENVEKIPSYLLKTIHIEYKEHLFVQPTILRMRYQYLSPSRDLEATQPLRLETQTF